MKNKIVLQVVQSFNGVKAKLEGVLRLWFLWISATSTGIFCVIFFLGMDASLICFTLSMFEIWLIFTSGKIIAWENRKQVAKTVINLKKIYLWHQHLTLTLRLVLIPKVNVHLSHILGVNVKQMKPSYTLNI